MAVCLCDHERCPYRPRRCATPQLNRQSMQCSCALHARMQCGAVQVTCWVLAHLRSPQYLRAWAGFQLQCCWQCVPWVPYTAGASLQPWRSRSAILFWYMQTAQRYVGHLLAAAENDLKGSLHVSSAQVVRAARPHSMCACMAQWLSALHASTCCASFPAQLKVINAVASGKNSMLAHAVSACCTGAKMQRYL